MSSILIKGMKMPKSCWECFFFLNSTELFKCNLTHKNVGNCRKNRHKNCPFVEIPTPHGDLIDRDDLLYEINRSTFVESYDYNTAYDAAALAETVIEEEGSHAEG